MDRATRCLRTRDAWTRTLRADRGAATVWVLAAGLLTVLVALAATTVGAAIVARHKAQAAADLAALAAAAAATEGEAMACAAARDIAAANAAQLSSCRLIGWDVVVTVQVVPAHVVALGMTARASARAGPA